MPVQKIDFVKAFLANGGQELKAQTGDPIPRKARITGIDVGRGKYCVHAYWLGQHGDKKEFDGWITRDGYYKGKEPFIYPENWVFEKPIKAMTVAKASNTQQANSPKSYRLYRWIPGNNGQGAIKDYCRTVYNTFAEAQANARGHHFIEQV